jgi:hypothetical protein
MFAAEVEHFLCLGDAGITDLEWGHVGAELHDPPDDLVARHDPVLRAAPVVADAVEVRVANPAVLDVDDDVVGTRAATDEGERQRGDLRKGLLRSLEQKGVARPASSASVTTTPFR